jgi:hypothetical protein
VNTPRLGVFPKYGRDFALQKQRCPAAMARRWANSTAMIDIANLVVQLAGVLILILSSHASGLRYGYFPSRVELALVRASRHRSLCACVRLLQGWEFMLQVPAYALSPSQSILPLSVVCFTTYSLCQRSLATKVQAATHLDNEAAA